MTPRIKDATVHLSPKRSLVREPNTSALPHEQDDLMELSAYLRIFRERWLVVLLCTMLGLGAAYGVARIIPPTYTSDAMLFLKVESDTGSLYERSQFSVQRIKSYPGLINSPGVLVPVMEQLQLDTSLNELRSRITATNPTDSVFLEITAEDSTAQGAANIANAVGRSLADAVRVLESSSGDESSYELALTIPATPPATPSSPQVSVILALGLMVGIAGGLIGAMLRNRLDRRVRTVSDVRRFTGLPVIAQMPKHSSRDAERSEAESAEAFHEFAQNVQILAGGQVPQWLTLVHASLTPSDARVGLARAIVNSGRTVCLLETQVDRRNGLGLLEEAPKFGLAEVLAGTADVADALVTIEGESFEILGTGSLAVCPSEHVSAQRFPQIAAELCARFDVSVAEAAVGSRPLNLPILAPVSDGVLIVSDYAHTRSQDLVSTIARVRAFGLNPLGVVVMSVPTRRRVQVSEHWRTTDYQDYRGYVGALPTRRDR